MRETREMAAGKAELELGLALDRTAVTVNLRATKCVQS
jgi:hypothetical protein